MTKSQQIIKLGSLLFIVLLVVSGYGQTRELTLIDQTDFTPIGYAEVKNLSTGRNYMTNAAGRVFVRSAFGDKFRIHALGYRDVFIALKKDTVLSLQKYYDKLPDISLVQKDLPVVKIGNKSKRQNKGLGMMTGNRFSFQVGLLIENKDSLLLQAVSFYVNKDCEKGAVYRLRLYEIEDDDSNESHDLLNSSMVLNLTCKRCWEEVVLPHSLFTDKNVLVALEWLPDALEVDIENGEGLAEVNSLNFFVSRSYYGKQCNMFSKAVSKYEDTGWKRYCPGFDSTSMNGKPLNLMVHVKAASLK